MDSLLRDINREQTKMQNDMYALSLHYDSVKTYLYQYIKNCVVEWAKLILDHPQSLLLIVETTPVIENGGYATGEHEPIRFTGMTLSDRRKWDMLVKPTHTWEVKGSEYHGLTENDLAPYLPLAECWHDIDYLLKDKHVIIFSKEWAISALRTVHVASKPYTMLGNAFDLHAKCQEFYSEFYHLSLETVLSYQGIARQRSELTNSVERIEMLGQVVENLANDLAKQEKPSEDEDTDNLEDHPF